MVNGDLLKNETTSGLENKKQPHPCILYFNLIDIEPNLQYMEMIKNIMVTFDVEFSYNSKKG